MWDFSCLKRFHWWWWWRSNGVRVFFLFGSHCVPSELIQRCVWSHRTASLLLTVSFYNPSVPIICSDYLQQATRPRRELGLGDIELVSCICRRVQSAPLEIGKWWIWDVVEWRNCMIDKQEEQQKLQPPHDVAVLILTRISGVCFKHVLNISTKGNKHLFLTPLPPNK